MKATKLFLTIIIFLTTVNLFAFDWQSSDLTEISQPTDKQKIFLETKNKIPVELKNCQNLSGKEYQKIAETVNEIANWQFILPAEIRISKEDNLFNVIIVPKSGIYKEKNLGINLPAELSFSFKNILEYNFRIDVKSIFIRISGIYISEELLCNKIYEAVENPELYIQRRDPEYFLNEISRIKSENEKLAEENAIREKEIKQINIEKQKIQYAIITLNNYKVFKGHTPVDPQIIEKIIELKISNPQKNYKEIKKLFKEKNPELKISSKEVKLILSVYFNEFSN